MRWVQDDAAFSKRSAYVNGIDFKEARLEDRTGSASMLVWKDGFGAFSGDGWICKGMQLLRKRVSRVKCVAHVKIVVLTLMSSGIQTWQHVRKCLIAQAALLPNLF